MSSSIIKNASFLFLAHLIGRGLSFALNITLPAYFEGGFEDLGKFFFALWLTNLISTFTELGLRTPVIRDIAADKSKAPLIITNALAVRLVLSIATLLIIAILAKLFYPGEMAVFIYVVGISEIINALAQIVRCVFRSFENMKFEALGVLVERSIVFLMGIGVVILGYGVIGFCLVVLLASIINLTLSLLIMVLRFSRLDLSLLDFRFGINLLRQSLPFALTTVIYMAYFRLDGIILKHIAGAEGDLAIGWYGAGYGFVTALTIIPGAFMGAVFPVMSREFASEKRQAVDLLYTKSMKLMLIIALPMAVFITFSASRIVTILYPAERFGQADHLALSIILKILIWAGGLIFLNTVLINVFRAADKRRAFLTITIISACVNFGLNLILIPRYSYIGSSISMVVSESLYFICGSLYVRKHVCKLSESSFIFKSAIASAILALGLFILKDTIKVVGVAVFITAMLIACAIYLAVVLLLKGITREDIEMVFGRYRE